MRRCDPIHYGKGKSLILWVLMEARAVSKLWKLLPNPVVSGRLALGPGHEPPPNVDWGARIITRLVGYTKADVCPRECRDKLIR